MFDKIVDMQEIEMSEVEAGERKQGNEIVLQLLEQTFLSER
jgi:hypothetical protein